MPPPKGGQPPPRPPPKGASAWNAPRAPAPGPSRDPQTSTRQQHSANPTPSTLTRQSPPTYTHNRKSTTYRIQLRKINPNLPCTRENIFKTAFETLNAPLIRLTDTRTGYYAVTDDYTAIDKLTAPRAIDAFKDINLTPITPPDLRAKKTVFIRQIDRYAGTHSPDEIKDEIETKNRHIKLDSVQKIKDYTHIIKLITKDTHTAQSIITQGFNMFNTRITPHQCEQEKYTHLLICFKCYSFENHPTNQCTSNTIICSECAHTGHTHHTCTSEHKQCINCQQNHRTLAASCPVRKTAIREKEEKERRLTEQKDHLTYAKIAQHTIEQTNATPKHQINITDKIHIKLTALILEAHIATLTGRPFGKTLSDSLKLNFDIDTKFPDRDSQEIFNLYLGDNSQPRSDTRTDPRTIPRTDPRTIPRTDPRTSSRTDLRFDPQTDPPSLEPTIDLPATTDDDDEDDDVMDTDTGAIPKQKRKASFSPQTITGADVRLYKSDQDPTPIPTTLTAKYIIDELENTGDYGLKLFVKDQSASQVYRDIADGRLNVRNLQIRTTAHDQFAKLPRISSNKPIKKTKQSKQQ